MRWLVRLIAHRRDTMGSGYHQGKDGGVLHALQHACDCACALQHGEAHGFFAAGSCTAGRSDAASCGVGRRRGRSLPR